MAFLTINEQPVVRASIAFPRIGVWHAELEIDAEEELSGAVELSFADGGLIWKGTVYRGGSFLGKTTAIILGGAGSLGKELPPKFYEGVPLRLPLQDALLEAGEQLSLFTSQEILNFLLQKWTRLRGAAGRLVLDLANAAGASWRVLSTGEVWLGVDDFPAFIGDFTVLQEDLARQYAVLDQDLPVILPGVSLDGKKVGRVVYDLSASSMSTKVWYDR